MDYMFADLPLLLTVNMISEKNAKISSMISAFENSENLNTFNMVGFNTGNIKSLKRLFYNTQISNIDMFDTSNVQDMSYMFAFSSLSNIDLEN